MENKNKYGLSRNIPAPTKREVRQYCGFGCVICGLSIIEYEHVDPPFSEAREHDPANITLLCPQCHEKVTRGFLSKETVKEASKNPYCKRKGYAREFLDINKKHPKVVFGGITLKNCQIPIMVRDIPLFEVKEAEEAGGPYRLSANFYNSRGKPSLDILDNEWHALDTNWDVEAVGGAITIRDDPKKISLRLVAEPPDGVIIERLDMYLAGQHFLGNSDTIQVGSRILTRVLVDGCRVGLHIE